MIFHLRQKKVNVNVPLTLENTVIKQVTKTKLLGILIDQHLSWNPHIDFASKKILKRVGIIAKARFLPIIANFDDLVLLPCISFLSLLFQPKLYLAFAKAYSAVHNKSSLSSLKVLDIFSIISFSVATFMYSYHHNLLPSSFRDLFLNSNQVHQYET